MEELGNVEATQAVTPDTVAANILKKLCADEWIAYCQYQLGKYAAIGRQLNALDKLFDETAEDELKDHMVKLMNWMQSKDWHPEFDYIKINEMAGTKFVPISDGTTTAELITIAINAENEAIQAYTNAMEAEEIKAYPDLVVILGEILADERTHLKELQDLRSSVSSPNEVVNFSKRVKGLFRNFSSEITEEDRVKVLEYANTLATEVFGDKKDDEIVKKVVDHAISESDDLESALGMIKSSYTH